MNLWTQFNALAPGSPRHVGEITAVEAYPYCTVTLIPSGVSMVVAGPGRTLASGGSSKEEPSGAVPTADV